MGMAASGEKLFAVPGLHHRRPSGGQKCHLIIPHTLSQKFARATGDEFYDYGPDTQAFGLPEVVIRGDQWWDSAFVVWGREEADRRINEELARRGITEAQDDYWDHWFQVCHELVGLRDILEHLPKLASEGRNDEYPLDVFLVEISAKCEEAESARQWWKHRYANIGFYSPIGSQCTSTVKKSLNKSFTESHAAGTWLLKKPISYLKKLHKDARHGCGPNKGRPVKIKHLQTDKKMQEEGY